MERKYVYLIAGSVVVSVLILAVVFVNFGIITGHAAYNDVCMEPDGHAFTCDWSWPQGFKVDGLKYMGCPWAQGRCNNDLVSQGKFYCCDSSSYTNCVARCKGDDYDVDGRVSVDDDRYDGTDCDDSNKFIFGGNWNEFCDCNESTGGNVTAGTDEICDLKDNDCDGDYDEGLDCNFCRYDDAAGACVGECYEEGMICGMDADLPEETRDCFCTYNDSGSAPPADGNDTADNDTADNDTAVNDTVVNDTVVNDTGANATNVTDTNVTDVNDTDNDTSDYDYDYDDGYGDDSDMGDGDDFGEIDYDEDDGGGSLLWLWITLPIVLLGGLFAAWYFYLGPNDVLMGGQFKSLFGGGGGGGAPPAAPGKPAAPAGKELSAEEQLAKLAGK